MATYAYVCHACRHLASVHRLTSGATSVVIGPYRCPCGCEISQTDPMYGIDRATYDRRVKDLRPKASEPS